MPGATPAPVPPPPQCQPPIGSSPATGATPNAGNAIKGHQVIGAALKMLAMGVALVGAGSPLGQKSLKAMQDIGKDLPPGSATESGEKSAVNDLQMQQQKMGPAMAMMRQGAAAPPGAAPGGAPPPSPPPMAA